jgi:hypothetical protein
MTRQIKQGEGWRIGWDPDAQIFQGLIAGQDWAIETTEAELNDFCRLATQLASTMRQMSSELMEEERISCEAESDLVWLEVEGFPHAYRLHFILLSGRRAEGTWSEAAVPALIQAAQTLKVF